MMQSILPTTSKTKLSEVNNDTKVAEELTNVEGKEGSEKKSLLFSDVLKSLFAGESAKEGSTESKPSSDEALQLASEEENADDVALQGKLPEENLLPDSAEGATELADGEKKVTALGAEMVTEKTNESGEAEEQTEFNVLNALNTPDSEKKLAHAVKNAAENETKIDSTSEAEEKLGDESDNLQVQENAINPIIAQIEAAQKTDTQVKESLKSTDKSLQENSKLTFENVLADEPNKLGKELLNKELLTKESLFNTDKLESLMPAVKSDFSKSLLNHNVEGNVFNAIGATASSADRLLSQSAATPAAALQSAALQQPLELQAKHASAMVGERILMMLSQGKQEVTIRLDPSELGSMHIKLQVQQDQLQVAIQTQVGQSREIIEQNLPRLREQLAQQGINLAEASVEQQSNQQQSNSQDANQSSSTARNGGSTDDSAIEEQSEWIATQIQLPAQGIDYYA
jgi:flagellar hook-length control protein FliK